MIRSMFTAISALNLHQTYLDVISDNLANANTTGYKSSRVVFQDQFAQIMSSGSAPTNQYRWYQPHPGRSGCETRIYLPGLYPGYAAKHRPQYRPGRSRAMVSSSTSQAMNNVFHVKDPWKLIHPVSW